MVSITMETTGTMLVGSDIASALTILEPFNIDILDLIVQLVRTNEGTY